jgi:hypothetical protein
VTSASTDVTRSSLDGAGAWHLATIAALGISAGLIYITGSVDTCSAAGRAVLFAGWNVMPVIALASLATASAISSNRSERRLGYAVTLLLTIGWAVALANSSIGPAMRQVGC